jgi:hypothetical protein
MSVILDRNYESMKSVQIFPHYKARVHVLMDVTCSYAQYDYSPPPYLTQQSGKSLVVCTEGWAEVWAMGCAVVSCPNLNEVLRLCITLHESVCLISCYLWLYKIWNYRAGLAFLALWESVKWFKRSYREFRYLYSIMISDTYSHTVGRTPWTGDHPVTRLLTTHRINTRKHPCLEWESNPRSQRSNERTKTVHAIDRATTVIGSLHITLCNPHEVGQAQANSQTKTKWHVLGEWAVPCVSVFLFTCNKLYIFRTFNWGILEVKDPLIMRRTANVKASYFRKYQNLLNFED